MLERLTEQRRQELIDYCEEEVRLKTEHIARLEKHMPGEFDLTRHELELHTARIALASLTAEPVFEVEISGNHWLNAGPVDDPDFTGMPDGVNKLYTAPPVPALRLPPELEMSDAVKMNISSENMDFYNIAIAEVRAINANAPVAKPVKLPPAWWVRAGKEQMLAYPKEVVHEAIRTAGGTVEGD